MPSACACRMSSGISCSIGRQPETWKPPIITWMPASRSGRAISTRAGEFVGLHADDADQPEPAMLGDAAHRAFRHDAGVGLVDGDDVDRQIGAEHAALGGAVGQAEHRGQRIRRHGRAQPLHDVAVGVVMRRFDQDQLKAPCRAAVCCRASLSPRKTISAERKLERLPASLSLPTGRLPAFASSTPENTAGWTGRGPFGSRHD